MRVLAIALLATPACSKIVGIDDVTVRDAGPGIDRPPSCMGLEPNCGTDANEDCCRAEMVPGTDPGSVFYRSYDVATDAYDNAGYQATVSTFVLDKYEVTVGRFRAFVNAGMGTQASPPVAEAGAHPKLPGSGWTSTWNTSLAADTAALIFALKSRCGSFQPWTDDPGPNENNPMACVSWYEAMAFCIWDGGYLPTELEWNYAASGGTEQRAYPWSDPASSTTIDCTYANYQIDVPTPGMRCVNGTTGGANLVGSEAPEGDGRWGHSDLAGNVWEWTLDGYGSYPVLCDDCANLTVNSERVVRGGSFASVASCLRTAERTLAVPSPRFEFGLRCARTYQPPSDVQHRRPPRTILDVDLPGER